MWATRHQFPVGQGCFHAGAIGHTDSASDMMHYIYDCGSTRQRALQNAIDMYKTRTSSIDFLFVSHFDADHVSGLDRLLAAATVDTVYIPYVDQVTYVLDLVEAEMNGVLSVSLIEATLEPESWFGRRGVRRVVRIRGSGDSPVDGPGTAGPDDFPESPTEDESRWSEDLRGKSERELTFRELPLPVRRRRSGGRLGEHGELLEAEPGFRIVISTRYRSPQWLLLPHVDPAPVERRAAFRVAMRATLGLQPRQRLTSRRLSQALQDGKRREALRECYDEIIAGGARRNHNRVSMSLYSGPESWSANQTWKYWVQSCDLVRQFFRWSDMAWVPWELEFRPLLWRAETSSIGWIGSGDAALKMKSVRKRWQETYGSVENQICTLLLPHHGSIRSFHRELLNFPNLELCVASAGNPSAHRHPSEAVVDMIRERGRRFCHVSQHIHSGLWEKMSLR